MTQTNPLDMIHHQSPEQCVKMAGLEAAALSTYHEATQSIITRFATVYDNIAATVFDRDKLKGIFSVYTGADKDTQTKEQKKFHLKADALGYIKLSEIRVPTIDGLNGDLFSYIEFLASHGDFGQITFDSLNRFHKVISEISNRDDALQSITTNLLLNSIDTNDKYRAKFHNGIREYISKPQATNETSFGQLSPNVSSFVNALDYRNQLVKTIDVDFLERVNSKVHSLSSIVKHLTDQITSDDERFDVKANAKVVAKLSEVLYNVATMTTDYGAYVHRVNSVNLVMDEIIKRVNDSK